MLDLIYILPPLQIHSPPFHTFPDVNNSTEVGLTSNVWANFLLVSGLLRTKKPKKEREFKISKIRCS